ncbi:MAG: pentapeptide repeat-containing protein [Bacteriovoracaceae bacterium]|nr:pentapeptide repeat-containing protein [Bacteriovoracaceae bacterium]
MKYIILCFLFYCLPTYSYSGIWWQSKNLFGAVVKDEQVSGRASKSGLRKVVLTNVVFDDYDWKKLEYSDVYLKDTKYLNGVGHNSLFVQTQQYFTSYEKMTLGKFEIRNSNWTYGEITDSSISEIVLFESRVDNLSFDNDQIQKVNIVGGKLNIFKIQYSKIENWVLAESQLQNGKLYEVELGKINFRKVEMKNQSFRNVYVKDSRIADFKFNNGDMLNSVFEKSLISFLDIKESNLQGIKFKGGELSRSHFLDNNMRGAKFTDLTIKNTTFEKVDLENATFKNVKFINSKFVGTTLDNVKFENVSGLN